MTLLFQQRSVIRYYCLRGKTNAQIVAKLEEGYHQDALCLRTVEKWAVRFQAGRETVEDDERPERRPQNDLDDAVLRSLEKQPHSPSREISKALYLPWTTILRVLDDLELRFFAPSWISHRSSDAQKADRVELSERMLDMMQALGRNNRYILSLRTSPGFTGTINTAECGHKTEMSCPKCEADDLVKKEDGFCLVLDLWLCFR
jgi:hypothetical protein